MRERLETLASIDPRLAPFPAIGALPSSLATGLIDRYVSAMDGIGATSKRALWVEKTPIHLHRIPLISRRVDNARFIHVIRAGVPAIASLYSVSRKYPADWGRRSLDACIERWRQDARISIRYRTHPEHYFVSYEQLVSDTEDVLTKLDEWLAVSSESTIVEGMVRDYRSESVRLSINEPWKGGVAAPIANRNSERIDELWDIGTQNAIELRIAAETRAIQTLPYLT